MRSLKLALIVGGTTGLVSLVAPQGAFAQLPNTCLSLGPDAGGFTYQNWVDNNSITCTVGDKIYSNFNFTGAGWVDKAFSITQSNLPGALSHSFGSASTYIPTDGTLTYSYTVTVDPASPWSIYAYATTIGSSMPTGTNGGTKSLTASPITGGSPDCPTLSGSFSSTGTGSWNSPSCLHDLAKTLNYSGVVQADSGVVNTWSDTITQTPGPLSILGAGAALGFSRKLRSRIKASL